MSLGLVAWRSVDWVNDLRKLHGQTLFVKHQHRDLKAILQDPSVAPLLGRCGPITVPTHSAIPVIEYETGLPKNAIQASIAQKRPPDHGLLFIGSSFNFEPAAAALGHGFERELRAPVVVELPALHVHLRGQQPVLARVRALPGRAWGVGGSKHVAAAKTG